MCLWLLTACLGLLPNGPTQQAQIIIVQGVPTPILQPTTAATAATPAPTTATTATMSTQTMAPTAAPTTASTARPTTPTTMTPAPTMTTQSSTSMTPTTARPTSPGNIISTITSLPTSNPTITTPQTINTSSTPSTIKSNTSGGMETIVLVCDNPDAICVSNPDDNTAGQLPIDPRLGSTPAAQFRLPPISGYNAQNPSFDTAVKFPREKRSIDEYSKKIAQYVYDSSEHRIRKRQSSCRCVPAGTCVKTTNGNGMIDIRIVTPTAMPCPAGQENCCGSTTSTIACGTLQTSPSPVVTPAAGQANFGEYPWQALILTKQNDYIAGGVLIDQLNVITVIHRLSTYVVSGTAPNVKVRLGEWDAAGTYEPVPFQEYTVAKVFTHPSFNPNTLQYDIAVLRLTAAVPLTPMVGSATTINRACLPPSSTTQYTGQRCWVSGWGKDMFGMQGQFQQILKEVDVPIVAPGTCQSQMQTARLGASYVLDTTSFICAGGEASKDSCTGDGGSGLVCQVQGQWVVVGLVAWGLGCANANVPAAYVNVAALLPWIQQQVATA
ncbi:unnamed protein product [Leptosia nina]|uniref:Peptidase S1 domain-containing protein n=1 Tax=Leptosia nina TaxID=320188 RepID=A0AAV1IS59_9NEOP